MVQSKRLRRLIGAAALVAIIAGIVYPVLAVDFDGDHSGETLTAGDNIFNFLAGFIGTNITVKTTVTNATVNFSNAPTGVTVDLSNDASYQTVYAGLSIWFQGFNVQGNGFYLYGSAYDDTLTGSPGDDAITGNVGNDTINGNAGDDTIYGDAGNDTLDGGMGGDHFADNSGNDMTVDLSAGTATGNGSDTLTNIEHISVGGGNDTLIGDGNGNLIVSGAGNDTIDGGGGGDTFGDFTGNDMTVDLSAGTAAGNGSDTLTNIEGAWTGSGNDTLIGDSNDNHLTGGLGNDTIDGGAGTDIQYDSSASECAGDVVTNVEFTSCPAVVVVPVVVPSQPLTPELCVTDGTRMAFDASRNLITIYSDFEASNPNGMIITEIPLSAIRAVTEDEKAANAWVPLLLKDSEFAAGWSVGLYWQANHYGVIVYKDGGKTLFEDTGAICGWF